MRVLLIAALAIVLTLVAALFVSAAQNLGTNTQTWANTPMTTNMWTVINSGDVAELQKIVESDASAANVRAEDGRSPLHWAYEHKNQEMIDLLIKAGAKEDEKDIDGKTPKEITEQGATKNKPTPPPPAPEDGPVSSGDDEDDDV
jgi:ankyrin repeat protein